MFQVADEDNVERTSCTHSKVGKKRSAAVKPVCTAVPPSRPPLKSQATLWPQTGHDPLVDNLGRKTSAWSLVVTNTYWSAGGLTAHPASSSSRSPGRSSEPPPCYFSFLHLNDDPPKRLSNMVLKSPGTFSAPPSQNQRHFLREAERQKSLCRMLLL